MRLFVMLSCLFLSIIIYLLFRVQYVQPSIEASLTSPAVKRAMEKMGPLKTYRLYPLSEGGRLEVMVEGKWLRLRY